MSGKDISLAPAGIATAKSHPSPLVVIPDFDSAATRQVCHNRNIMSNGFIYS